ALARSDGKTVVETTEDLRVNGLSAASTLEEMSVVLQRMAVLQAVPDALDVSDPEAAEISRLAELLPPDETQLLYSLCLHGRGELGLAPDEYAALTMVLLRLLAFKPAPASAGAAAEKKTLKFAEATPTPSVTAAVPAAVAPVPAVQARAPTLAPVAASSSRESVPPPAAQAAAPAAAGLPPGQRLAVRDGAAASTARPHALPDEAQPPADSLMGVPVRVAPQARVDAPPEAATLVPTEDGAFWYQTVQQLVASEAVTALVRELALQSQLVARDTDHWLLRVERESLNQPTSRERLQAALQTAGHAVRLGVEVGRVLDSPARRIKAAAAEKQQAAEKIIYEDPFVQAMMRDFGAKIVPGSIKPLEPNT
ncbi:MAG: DNA polymerase III subunit gamma/tau, partial [Hylemonella sp.]|nr:DNA polymerase III subunit gamma/tau [Hylemonella sp.]